MSVPAPEVRVVSSTTPGQQPSSLGVRLDGDRFFGEGPVGGTGTAPGSAVTPTDPTTKEVYLRGFQSEHGLPGTVRAQFA